MHSRALCFEFWASLWKLFDVSLIQWLTAIMPALKDLKRASLNWPTSLLYSPTDSPTCGSFLEIHKLVTQGLSDLQLFSTSLFVRCNSSAFYDLRHKISIFCSLFCVENSKKLTAISLSKSLSCTVQSGVFSLKHLSNSGNTLSTAAAISNFTFSLQWATSFSDSSPFSFKNHENCIENAIFYFTIFVRQFFIYFFLFFNCNENKTIF